MCLFQTILQYSKSKILYLMESLIWLFTKPFEIEFEPLVYKRKFNLPFYQQYCFNSHWKLYVMHAWIFYEHHLGNFISYHCQNSVETNIHWTQHFIIYYIMVILRISLVICYRRPYNVLLNFIFRICVLKNRRNWT